MIEGLLARFGYLAVFGLLLAAGAGVPIPEETTQLAAGALAHAGYLLLVPAMVTCWLGIVAGDLTWFHLARRLGPAVLDRRPVRKVLTTARRARIEAHLARHAFWTVAVARHLSGLRFLVFALAATHGVRTRTFLLADALSALVSVPLVVSAGYFGAHHLAAVHGRLRRVELAVVGLVVLAAVVLLVLRRMRDRRGAKPDADER